MSEQSLGEILDSLRINRGFPNQTEFAAALTAKGFKADKSQVNRWLNGERTIPFKMLVGFILILGLDEEERNNVLRAAQQEKIIKHFDDVVSLLDRAEHHALEEIVPSNPSYGEFGEQLSVILRIRDDASGTKLARQLGLDLGTVSSWLRGETYPVVPQLIDAIASGLNLTGSEREGLLYAAGYEAHVESKKYGKIEDSDTIEQVRAEAEKRGIDRYIVDRLFHMLTRHPSPDYEFSSNKTMTRVVISAATLVTTGLVVVLFMAFFAPATLETLRGIIERPWRNEPTPTATSLPNAPIVELTTLPVATVTPTPVATELSPTATIEILLAPTMTITIAVVTEPTATATPMPQTSTPTPAATDTPIPTVFPTVKEDFSSNDRNWYLGTDSRGTVRISQGRLVMSPNTNSILWIPVPDVQVNGDFYFQAQVSLLQGHFCDSDMGLSIGEEGGNHHSFIIGYDCGIGSYVAFLNGSRIESRTPVNITSEALVHVDSPVRTIGLEAKNGVYTFYVEGQSVDIFPIEETYGNSIGLLAWDEDAYLPTTIVAFDNIIVREQK
jgi:transcriptional regulator with XRE-family HTH domain